MCLARGGSPFPAALSPGSAVRCPACSEGCTQPRVTVGALAGRETPGKRVVCNVGAGCFGSYWPSQVAQGCVDLLVQPWFLCSITLGGDNEALGRMFPMTSPFPLLFLMYFFFVLRAAVRSRGSVKPLTFNMFIPRPGGRQGLSGWQACGRGSRRSPCALPCLGDG